jgi:hypothetical protein
MVMAVAPNGANLVIKSAQTEQVFSCCGIDFSKKVMVCAWSTTVLLQRLPKA